MSNLTLTRKLRVLLVEDEVILAMALGRELRLKGYAISDHVTTGEDAVLSVREERPDLILMDIRLAGPMDGIEAAGRIQAEADIPILFMSGYSDVPTRDRAQRLNPVGYLNKPFSVEAIAPLLEASGRPFG